MEMNVETHSGIYPHRWLGIPRDVGKSDHYFASRSCFVDYRGELKIDPTAEFGFNVCIFTATHYSNWLLGGKVGYRHIKVIIGPRAWICSNAVLFNCTIGEGAIVGLGAVVRSMDVESFTMVVGNPAKVIKVFEDGKWQDVWKEHLR